MSDIQIVRLISQPEKMYQTFVIRQQILQKVPQIIEESIEHVKGI